MAGRFFSYIGICAILVGSLIDSAAAQRPELVIQTGHNERVMALAFSEDGSILASGGGNRSIVLWDVASGRQLRALNGHQGSVTSVAFEADGNLLSASWDGTVRRWNPEDKSTGSIVVNQQDAITLMVPSLSGEMIATAGFDGILQLWDARDLGEPIQIAGEALGGGDGLVVLALEDSSATLLDIDTQSQIYRLARMPDRGPLTVSRQSGVLAYRSGGTLPVIDLADGSLRHEFRHHGMWVMDFDPLGSRVATGSWDREVRPGIQANHAVTVWNSDSGGLAWSHETCRDRQLCEVTGVTFASDGSLVAAGLRGGGIIIWNTETGERLNHLEPQTSNVYDLSFGPTSGTFASVAADPLLRLWDFRVTSDQRPLAKYEHISAAGRRTRSFVSIRADGGRIALAGEGWRPAVDSPKADSRFWDLLDGQEVTPPDSILTWTVARTGAPTKFSPDGSLYAGLQDGYVVFWDGESLDRRARIGVPDSAIYQFAFDPTGDRLVTVDAKGWIRLWDMNAGSSRTVGVLELAFEAGQFVARDLEISPNGRILALALNPPRRTGTDADGRFRIRYLHHNAVMVWDLEQGRRIWQAKGHETSAASVSFAPTGKELATAGADGVVRIWDSYTGELVQELVGGSHAEYSPDGQFLVGTGGPMIRFWHRTDDPADSSFKPAATLVGFRDGSWAVVDRQGRFDGSNGGDVDGLHWVIGNEVVALGQLKDRYYEPGLMQKILGYADEPLRDVSGIRERKVELWPSVQVANPDKSDGRLDVELTDRGGGIGRVVIRINGKEVTPDARPRGFTTDDGGGGLSIDVGDSPFLIPGIENEIEVIAYNNDGHLHSRGVKRSYTPPQEVELPPIALWALVVGVSDYRGEDLDLTYAARDAHDFANALSIGADALFEGRVDVTLLSSEPDTPAATRKNILNAIEDMARASPTDVVVAYFAGHGIAYGGSEGDFHYLTQEAATGDLSDPIVRSSTTISGIELNRLLGRVPALKQALILDTCQSGGIVASLGDKRSLPPSRRHALERMKDRNSVFVLAGSAADAVSYEASRYGQGLLTYSLLMGMKGASLRDGEFVDVARLFDFARDRVPQLARGIGGIQEPVVAVPRGGSSFDIGELAPPDRDRIPLSIERPLILRAAFQDRDLFDDRLDLGAHVNAALRVAGRSHEPKIYFVDARDFQDGYRIAGQYTVRDGRVDVVARVFRGRLENVAEVTVSGPDSDVRALADQIVDEISAALGVNR